MAATATATPVTPVTPAPDASHDVIGRVARLPLVEVALLQSAGVYQRVKESSSWANWALLKAEASAQLAMEVAKPVVAKLPLAAVDEKLCRGLDFVQAKFPVVNEQPEQIYEDVKVYSLDKMAAAGSFGAEKTRTLVDLSWAKANEILAARYGNMAFEGFGMTTAVAEKYFDYYFPPSEQEAAEITSNGDAQVATNAEVVDDRVAQTIHTVGRISHKLVRRVQDKVSSQVRSLNTENAHEYVRSLVALLTLDKYIGSLPKDNKNPEPAVAETTNS